MLYIAKNQLQSSAFSRVNSIVVFARDKAAASKAVLLELRSLGREKEWVDMLLDEYTPEYETLEPNFEKTIKTQILNVEIS